MNSTILLALALVLVLEGLGPMLYPRAWKKMISAMDAQQKAAQKAQAGRNAARSAVRKEVSNNEAVRDWHNSPVPPSLVRMLSSRDHGAD